MTIALLHHDVQHCHWAVPTLFMPHPVWLDAWDFPWCCWNSHEVRVLAASANCQACPNFKPRDEAGAVRVRDIRPDGAVRLRSGASPIC